MSLVSGSRFPSDSAIPREVYEGNFRYDLFHGYGVMRRPWFRDQGLGAQGNARSFRQLGGLFA